MTDKTRLHEPLGAEARVARFTALENACIRLKVLHPDLPRWLYDLIVEARRLDAAQAATPHALGVFTATNLASRYINEIVKPDPEIK